jgi:hypothetical protein
MTATNNRPVEPRTLRLDSPLLKPEQAAELLAVRTRRTARKPVRGALPGTHPVHPAIRATTHLDGKAIGSSR